MRFPFLAISKIRFCISLTWGHDEKYALGYCKVWEDWQVQRRWRARSCFSEMPSMLQGGALVWLPVQNTKMSVAESKRQIENLLHENGGMSYQWFEDSKRLALIFSLETRGKKRIVRLVPPILITAETHVPLWPATYRLLYWGLKPRLQAIQGGAAWITSSWRILSFRTRVRLRLSGRISRRICFQGR